MGAERMGSIFSHGKVPANQDLLGLGTIDFRNAALVRDGSPLGLVRHGSFHKRTGVGRTWSNSLGNKKMAMAPRLSALGHGPSKEDLALLASSDAFDPKTYLGKVHRYSSQEDLKKGQLHLTKQLNEGKDQRMLLVKENFERFIKCKNTIDDMVLAVERLLQDKGLAIAGDEVIIIMGTPLGVGAETNLIKFHRVGGLKRPTGSHRRRS